MYNVCVMTICLKTQSQIYMEGPLHAYCMVTSTMKRLPKFSARSRLNVEPEKVQFISWDGENSAATSGYQWPMGYLATSTNAGSCSSAVDAPWNPPKEAESAAETNHLRQGLLIASRSAGTDRAPGH